MPLSMGRKYPRVQLLKIVHHRLFWPVDGKELYSKDLAFISASIVSSLDGSCRYVHNIFIKKNFSDMHSFWLEMIIQSVSESLILTEQIAQVVSLKSSEVYLSTDIKYVGVITKGNTWSINSEILHAAGIQCICGAMGQSAVKPDLLTYPKC